MAVLYESPGICYMCIDIYIYIYTTEFVLFIVLKNTRNRKPPKLGAESARVPRSLAGPLFLGIANEKNRRHRVRSVDGFRKIKRKKTANVKLLNHLTAPRKYFPEKTESRALLSRATLRYIMHDIFFFRPPPVSI